MQDIYIEQFILVLAFLAATISVPTLAAVETLKPLFLIWVKENFGNQVYLILVYAIRIMIGVGIYFASSAETTILHVMPSLEIFPSYLILIVTVSFASVGTSSLHFIGDFLGEMREVMNAWRQYMSREITLSEFAEVISESVNDIEKDFDELKNIKHAEEKQNPLG